jgi:hypothetical protein
VWAGVWEEQWEGMLEAEQDAAYLGDGLEAVVYCSCTKDGLGTGFEVVESWGRQGDWSARQTGRQD